MGVGVLPEVFGTTIGCSWMIGVEVCFLDWAGSGVGGLGINWLACEEEVMVI
jgi:hypothetical protein